MVAVDLINFCLFGGLRFVQVWPVGGSFLPVRWSVLYGEEGGAVEAGCAKFLVVLAVCSMVLFW